MHPDYWLERWEKGRIGFHRLDVNPRLVEHHKALDGVIRVLVPLCGKSVDLEWLVVQGFEVVGIELSELAAQAFFSERGFVPERRNKAKVLTLNLRNRLIFRAADEADAVQAADFLGKKRVVKRSWGYSAGRTNSNYSETE